MYLIKKKNDHVISGGRGAPKVGFPTHVYLTLFGFHEKKAKGKNGVAVATLESRERMCDVVLFFIIIAFNFVNCDSACPGQDLH